MSPRDATSEQNQPQAALALGVYEHYRGDRYLVLGVARLDDTDEPVVVYVRMYSRDSGGAPMTVRRLDSFSETVIVNGAPTPRFRWLGYYEPEAQR